MTAWWSCLPLEHPLRDVICRSSRIVHIQDFSSTFFGLNPRRAVWSKGLCRDNTYRSCLEKKCSWDASNPRYLRVKRRHPCHEVTAVSSSSFDELPRRRRGKLLQITERWDSRTSRFLDDISFFVADRTRSSARTSSRGYSTKPIAYRPVDKRVVLSKFTLDMYRQT